MGASTPPGPAGRGRPLFVEVAVPVGLGLLGLVATLGVAIEAVSRAGGPVVPVALTVGLVLAALLGVWVAWVVRDAALRPLERLGAGVRGLEDGDFAARIAPDGAREFRDLAHSFNRTVAFLDHQRGRLKALAGADPLTGLANHRSLHEQLRALADRAAAGDGPLGVVVLDLDGFRRVNDERGHARGDEVLAAVGAALRGAVREGDVVARPSGDEFVLLLRDLDGAHVRDLSERARRAAERALPAELGLACSAGFVCAPGQAAAGADLVDRATAALRTAKRAGGARTCKWDADRTANEPTGRAERLEVEALLASAEPIVPVFQPIVAIGTGRVVGYEALARFPVAAGGEPRSPDAWFAQAGRVGLGPQLEAVAVSAALRAPERPAGTYLSVNLTPTGISSSLVRASLPPDLRDVVIEVTEHELAAQDGALDAGLADLRSRGARIAIDDAGAGYAGLQQVMRVQPDLIKLDRSLVADVDTDPARAALIEFFVVFARRIEATVCCEGIETPGELAALATLDVPLGQGYLLGRPAAPWVELAPAAAAAMGALRPVAGGAYGDASARLVNRRLGRAARR